MNSELKWSRVGTKSKETIGCRIQYNVCTTISTWKLFSYFTFYTESFAFV